MRDLWPLPAEINWPLALALAWVCGEIAFRALRLPRISTYGIVGFVLAAPQAGFLPQPESRAISVLANVALGLILFELGYRINLRWLRFNPWIGLTSVLEAFGTFAVVFAVASLLGTAEIPALLVSALAMSTSPAAVVRVVNEQNSSGQVTERVLHLTAFNCMLAVVVFKAIVGYSILSSSGDLPKAVWNGLLVFVFSGAIGALFGVGLPKVIDRLDIRGRGITLAFAIAVILLVAVTHSVQYSPAFATLIFGVTARHRRIVLGATERNFGTLGNVLTVWLFVYVAAALDWHNVYDGAAVAAAIVATRLAVKVAATTSLARVSGVTWRKGALSGLALTPFSAFVLLLLEPTRVSGLVLVEGVGVVAAMVLMLEVVGPVVTQWALIWAKEVPETGER